MLETEQEDIISKRLNKGQEAKRILAEPLLREFFDNHLEACRKAFSSLPMGCTLEQYQTVHHDLLAIQRLLNTFQAYIKQAERDNLEMKEQDKLENSMV